tara:strand:+ start:657 stop:845 length:189 start_codon:yes stop_codon:yes gene_type:complete
MDLKTARRAPRLPHRNGSDLGRQVMLLVDAAFVLGLGCGVLLTIVIDLGLRDGLLVNWLFGS